MKKIIAAASALALTAGLAFAETHETLKAHTLQTSVGDISFGAWGRSTFNVGRQNTSTKITADLTATGNAVAANAAIATGAETSYADALKEGGNFAAVSAAAAAAGFKLEEVSLKEDLSNLEDYATAVATYNAVNAMMNGQTVDGETLGNLVAGNYIIKALKAQEKDESNSRGYMGLEPDWSYGNRVGFWIIGRTPDQHFGFDFNLDADARALFVHKLWDSDEDTDDVNYNEDGKYAVAIGDQAKIWGLFDNPLFQTKVAFGRMREQELRGTIGDFGQRESSDVKSEDDIFQEIWTATGLFLSAKANEDSPLKGFYVNGAIDLAGTLGIKTTNADGTTTRSESAADTDSDKAISFYEGMRSAQAGVGYTLPGLFQIKAQYWGDSISENNYRYAVSTYKSAREAGFGLNDYYGRMEFGIDWLGGMGGATSFLDPALDLEKTPNAHLIELGFKVPIVTDNDLRDYDPEKFYNWYSCLGTMGVIQKGFIMYKGHVWGGQGVSNLSQYSYNLVDMKAGDGADILMAGFDFLTEVCVNPFGKQDLFVGLSGNYNITSASADGSMKSGLSVEDLKLTQHKFAAELYVKKTFAANNFMFAGIAGNFSIQKMEGTVNGIVDLSYDGKANRFYMPIGVEMFF